jgi:hypothetical protein
MTSVTLSRITPHVFACRARDVGRDEPFARSVVLNRSGLAWHRARQRRRAGLLKLRIAKLGAPMREGTSVALGGPGTGMDRIQSRSNRSRNSAT